MYLERSRFDTNHVKKTNQEMEIWFKGFECVKGGNVEARYCALHPFNQDKICIYAKVHVPNVLRKQM